MQIKMALSSKLFESPALNLGSPTFKTIFFLPLIDVRAA
jgi:hypothetical protein